METTQSPSGKYTLTISSTPTKPGCWNYTVGEVTRTDSGAKIATINRNYSSFPYCWVEDHPNGHSYLVGGANYQGQTVIELDTGERRDFVPEAAAKGHGFCWIEYEFNSDWQALVVEGCFWACPYECRFYDFSNPMQGWPEIVLADDCIDMSSKKPLINPDGTVTCYETKYEESDDDDDEEKERNVVATKTFKREGLCLTLIDEWVEPAEKIRRAEAAESQRIWNEKWEEYKKSDPIYLLVKKRVESDGFDNEGFVSIGQTYEGWCPHFTGREGLVCRRLTNRRQVGEHTITIDLEWGRETAPIKLILYRDGKEVETSWSDHSVEGMTTALAFAAGHLLPL